MHIRKTISIAAPVAAVWRCLVEPELIKRWIEDVVDDTPDDPAKTGLGAWSTMRIKEGGKVLSYRCLVTAWEPHKRVTVQLTGGSFGAGMAMDVDYVIAPEGNGTRVDYDVNIPLMGLGFKLLAPLIWAMSTANAGKSLRQLQAVAPTVS